MSCTGVWDAAAQDLHSGVLGTIGVNPAISGTGSINAPDNVGWGICLSLKYGEVKNLLLMDHQGVWIQRNDGISWSEWKKFSTATPPQEYDLPLADGVSATYITNKYFKTQEGIVQIDLNINANEQIPQGTRKIVAYLPEGYRPVKTAYDVVLTHYSGKDGIGMLSIGANGEVACSSQANSWQHFYGQILFPTAQ